MVKRRWLKYLFHYNISDFETQLGGVHEDQDFVVYFLSLFQLFWSKGGDVDEISLSLALSLSLSHTHNLI